MMKNYELYNKTLMVFNSVNTLEQMVVAIRYIRLAKRKAGKGWEVAFSELLTHAMIQHNKLKHNRG